MNGTLVQEIGPWSLEDLGFTLSQNNTAEPETEMKLRLSAMYRNLIFPAATGFLTVLILKSYSKILKNCSYM